MSITRMHHERDPKEVILEELGDINDIEIFNNQVFCAVYVRPEKTKSGLYVTDKTRDEDRYQGKVGLIVAMGPEAFKSDDEWFKDVKFNLHDWVFFRPSDGWALTASGSKDVLCRVIDDINIRGRIQHPDQVF